MGALFYQLSLWMYTMNRCLSPLWHPKVATKKVAARAIFYWATALFTMGIVALQPSMAHAQGEGPVNPPEQVPIAGEFVGRQFPANALRGRLRVVQGAEITIDGRPERLSPGARIRGTQNNVLMSGALVGQEYLVNFVRDGYSNVHQVWLLTVLEAQQKVKPATPARNFLFSSEGDKPKVDDGKTPFDQLPKYKQ
jgi:hypothetical protein